MTPSQTGRGAETEVTDPTPTATAPDALAPGAPKTVLHVADLAVEFHTDEGTYPAVNGISFDIRAGEVLALVGESGSGKTVTSLAVTGLLPSTARITGVVELDGENLLAATESRLNEVRGKDIAMIFQEPMTALNPTMTVGRQIAEVLTNHKLASRQAAWQRAVDLLTRVGLPDPAVRAHGYPHELSGGMRQRVVIAIALAARPKLIIADEPTTALDVTVQAEILDLIRSLAAERDTAFLLITHNMGVVADVAGRVAVMYRGDLVEIGQADQVLLHPAAAYSRELLDAVPKLPSGDWDAILEAVRPGPAVSGSALSADASPVPDSVAVAVEPPVPAPAPTIAADGQGTWSRGRTPHELPADAPALEFNGVDVVYRQGRTQFHAVHDVSLTVDRSEIVGLVGESGSGKSTLGRAALGLLPVRTGTVSVLGHPVSSSGLISRSDRWLRGRIGVIFQDPGSSLDPRLTIAESVAEPLRIHGWHGSHASSAFRRDRVAELLDAVELPSGYERRYPHELSGGQRQRVSLARAITLDPTLLIADEPTSALDVSVQARVLTLLKSLQERYGFAWLFISHDLAVVHLMAHRVAVMWQGELVERGPVDEILTRPRHPYSRRLLAAAPSPDPREQARRRAARRALAELPSEVGA